MIQPGRPPPGATFYEFFEVEKDDCVLGPNAFSVQHLAEGKTIVIPGLPGAFTPTRSVWHVPGYLANYNTLRAKGVDEIWCVSVNDAFVMGAWTCTQGTDDKTRMLGDGSAEFTSKLGLGQDLSKRGMGVRSQRHAMVVKDGAVTALQVEAPGQLLVSSAEPVLAVLRRHTAHPTRWRGIAVIPPCFKIEATVVPNLRALMLSQPRTSLASRYKGRLEGRDVKMICSGLSPIQTA